MRNKTVPVEISFSSSQHNSNTSVCVCVCKCLWVLTLWNFIKTICHQTSNLIISSLPIPDTDTISTCGPTKTNDYMIWVGAKLMESISIWYFYFFIINNFKFIIYSIWNIHEKCKNIQPIRSHNSLGNTRLKPQRWWNADDNR